MKDKCNRRYFVHQAAVGAQHVVFYLWHDMEMCERVLSASRAACSEWSSDNSARLIKLLLMRLAVCCRLSTNNICFVSLYSTNKRSVLLFFDVRY